MIILKNRKLLALSLATSMLLSNFQAVFAEVLVDDSFKDVGVTILEEREDDQDFTRDSLSEEIQENLPDENEEALDTYSEDKEENTLEENDKEQVEDNKEVLLEDEGLDSADEKMTESENDVLEINDSFKPEENAVQGVEDNFIYKDSAKTVIIGYKGKAFGDLVIPSNVVEIGPGAFAATPSRGSFTGRLDLSLATKLQTIGIGAFAGNNFTGDLVINTTNLKEIPAYAFYGNKFDNVNLKDSFNLTKIGQAAFAHSAGPNAGKIELPNSLEDIADAAFTGEATQGSLTLTKFDESTGKVVGTETLSLDREREDDNYGYSYFSMNGEFNKLQNIGPNAFSYNKLSQNLIFPKEIKTIGENAFTRNYLFGNLEFIDSSIESIGDNAFLNAYAKGVSINFSDDLNLNYIGKGAFQNNTFSQDLTLSNLPILTEINDLTFFSGKDVKGSERYFTGTLTIENLPKLERIGKKAFSYETELDPTLARNLFEVRSYNERQGNQNGFEKLAMTNIPNLKTIDSQAFMDNNFRNSMDFSEFTRLETIEDQAFSNAGFSGTINFNGMKNLKYVGESSFFNSDANNLNFKNSSIVEIKKLAFSGAKISEDLKIENLQNLTTIGQAAFQNAGSKDSLGDISIKDNPSLTVIENAAFNNYENQGNVTISGNKSLTTIEEFAFGQNYNEDTDSKNDLSKGLRLGPKLVISNNGIKTIEQYAFYNNTFKGILDLTNNPITTIGNGAFAFNGFICVELPNTVKASEGMKPGSDFNAFYFNNQNFTGKISEDNVASVEYFDLPIHVKDGKGISPLVSEDGEYVINFSGACQELTLVNVKVVDEETGELIEDKNVEIKLIQNPNLVDGTLHYNSVAKDVKGNPKASFDGINLSGSKIYAYITDVDPNNYDTTPIRNPIEVPAPVDGVSEVVVKLPKNNASLQINFLIEGTNEKVPGIKNNPLEYENEKIGTTFNLSTQGGLDEVLKSLKDNYGYEMVPNQKTSITLKKGANVLNIYFRSTGKTITVTKRDEKDPDKLMPCIKYGLYNKAEYDKAVQIQNLVDRKAAISNALIETQTTDENGKATFTNVSVDVRIVELGIDNGCTKCGKDKNSECDYDNYVPNKKITEITIDDFPDGGNIDYTGSVVKIIVPHTGTLGILPYAIACTLIAGLGFVTIKKKGSRRDF